MVEVDDIEVDDNTFGSVWFETLGVQRAFSCIDTQYYIVFGE